MKGYVPYLRGYKDMDEREALLPPTGRMRKEGLGTRGGSSVEAA